MLFGDETGLLSDTAGLLFGDETGLLGDTAGLLLGDETGLLSKTAGMFGDTVGLFGDETVLCAGTTRLSAVDGRDADATGVANLPSYETIYSTVFPYRVLFKR
jgi:hypothetical protein